MASDVFRPPRRPHQEAIRRDGARRVPVGGGGTTLIRAPYVFPYAPPSNAEWIAYAISAQDPASIWRSRAMADVIYLVLGLAFFGLMALYASACDRL